MPNSKQESQELELIKLRHSTEHVLMQAMENLFPGKILKAHGPATDDGFYFDFESLGYTVTETDFPKIEKEMKRLISADLPISVEDLAPQKAREIFRDNPYKQELINEIEDRGEPLTVHWTGEPNKAGSFVDLCSGPHLPSTGKIKAFKLLSLAGAYWRGDEKNKMLTRLYGTAFADPQELDQYLWRLSEAQKRDHRKLGQQLGLYTFSDLVGSGFPLYTPRGALIRRLINNYIEELQSKDNYHQVWTPQIAKAELFKISGHYDKYKDDMFRVTSHYSQEEFFLKPMNCPQHTQIYSSTQRSYKDLPLRITDFAMLYRDEKPGELSGLARVRAFSQDDCHIFAREDQVDQEIDNMLQMIKTVMSTFGLKYRYRLSTRDPKSPEKYLGEPKIWDKVESWAEKIMKRNQIEFFVAPGEAAFYAPKMDLMATDALGREWQLSTIQIDYVMPQRFNLTYIDKDGSEKHPVMLHRAIVGSAERFMMILLEHFAGALPLWLSPTQVSILPISDKTLDYSSQILSALLPLGIRAELNDTSETLGKKIRLAESQKVPYMVIIGEREAANNMISVRARGEKDLGQMTADEFIDKITTEIQNKVTS